MYPNPKFYYLRRPSYIMVARMYKPKEWPPMPATGDQVERWWLLIMENSNTDPPPENLKRLFDLVKGDPSSDATNTLQREYDRRGLKLDPNLMGTYLSVNPPDPENPDDKVLLGIYRHLAKKLIEKRETFPTSLGELARFLENRFDAQQFYYITKQEAVKVVEDHGFRCRRSGLKNYYLLKMNPFHPRTGKEAAEYLSDILKPDEDQFDDFRMKFRL